MTIYTLRSFASSGRIVSVQRLSAEDDEEAAWRSPSAKKHPRQTAIEGGLAQGRMSKQKEGRTAAP